MYGITFPEWKLTRGEIWVAEGEADEVEFGYFARLEGVNDACPVTIFQNTRIYVTGAVPV